MVFSSMTFLCVFLPVVFGLHCIVPGIRGKNAMLLLASLVFYAYGEPVYVFLLIISALFNYLCAGLIGRFSRAGKPLLFLAAAGNLAVLIYFKYTGFLVESLNGLTGMTIPVPVIRMPIGISFFTFQALSYVIDVYRGRNAAQRSFWKVLLYISFFPQLIAGPIVYYHDVEKEISGRQQTLEGVSEGIRRFSAGLCKKVLIANTMGLAADTLYGAGDSQVNILLAWTAAVSYMLQIYFDFSGYSDMAIGLGRMFGFHFKENFDYPYISRSIREFWRRWHISLSGWFREYLYFPLGGSRKGRFRTVANKMIVFICTGIWHGASLNFLFWGIYHGCFLLLEEYVPAIRREGGPLKTFIQRGYALLAVCLGFVFFRVETMGRACFWVGRMFTGFSFGAEGMALLLSQLTPVYLLTLAAALIACAPVKKIWKKRPAGEALSYILSLAGLALCVLSLAGGTYNPFIYFRF